MVENDCEDQALCETKHCTQCWCSFDIAGRPVYVALVCGPNRFWYCPNCHACYGEHPHPDLTELARVRDKLGGIKELWHRRCRLPDAAFDAIARAWAEDIASVRRRKKSQK